ncbi:MAG: hypothetical protein QOI16_3551 [Pseudonocardiales bacterium]|jgi:hypothetical protein|nr:hypothetical protein [Pseudonocardiales bacterium]
MSLSDRLHRLGKSLREFDAEVTELHERQRLLNRPWEEDFLHWAFDGQEWHLHGTLPPPAGRRRHSVTRNGWCVGVARERTRIRPAP